MNMENNEMRIVQYSFKPKIDLYLRNGDAFYWTLPIIQSQLMNMFIGFLSFTNEAILDRRKSAQNISLLDDTILNALDIDKVDDQNILEDD